MVAWILRLGGRLPFVAGIFTSRQAAEAHMATLPEASRARCSVGSRDELSLPCLLIEYRGDFRFLSAAEARDVLAETQPDEEGVYCNLYRVDGGYLPKVPGRDEMGRLPHWHLGAAHLAAIERGGLETLWSRRDEDAT